MGEDKSLLPFGNFPTLTQFQYNKLSKLFNNVYISTKDKNKFDFDANFIEDTKESNEFAPTVALKSIFEELICDKFFVITVDTPFISLETIEEMIKNNIDNSYDVLVAKDIKFKHPLIGIYTKKLLPTIDEMINTNSHKLGILLNNSNTIFYEIKDEKELINLNHPHEYEEALKVQNEQK